MINPGRVVNKIVTSNLVDFITSIVVVSYWIVVRYRKLTYDWSLEWKMIRQLAVIRLLALGRQNFSFRCCTNLESALCNTLLVCL